MNRVWLSESVAQQIAEEASHFHPLETGGVLLGHLSDGDTVVVACLGPGPDAKRTAMKFVPDHEYQVQQITDHFNQSAGRIRYLGDWHTHPVGPGTLSATDRKTIRRIANHSDAQIHRPTMLVFCNATQSFHAWQVQRSNTWLRWNPITSAEVTLYPKEV